MANLRDRIERGFERWGRFVIGHRGGVLVASLLAALGLAAGLPRITVDVTFEAFLGRHDAVRVAYDEFRERFGRDERIVVAVDPGTSTGPEGVFEARFLDRLRALHEAIEDRVPYVVEVTSLVNARDTRGEGDTLVVEDFLDPWPETPAERAARRARALDNPLFLDNVISRDAAVTTIAIEPELYSPGDGSEDALGGFDDDPGGAAGGDASASAPGLLSGAETAEQVEALYALFAEFEAEDFRLHAGGSPVLSNRIAVSMGREMPRFIALAIGSIALLLYALFRRMVAVGVPLLVVVLSVAATFGLMGWTGTSIHVPTQILPSFLLAVGVGDSVHLLSIFFDRLRHGDDRDTALCHALGHSGLALVLTSLTTAAGLASFATAAIEPVARIGVFAPIGVGIALFLSLTMLPAVLAWVPISATARDGDGDGATPRAFDRALSGLGRFAVRRSGIVLAGAALLALGAAVGASRMGLSHDPLGWLDPELPVVEATHFIDAHLGGVTSFEAVVRTEPGGVREPAMLEALAAMGESFEQEARHGHRARQSISLADVVKEINRALQADASSAYVIPDDPLLVAQELLLFENTGSDDLEDLTDSQFELARLTVRLPWGDAVGYAPYVDQAVADVEARLGAFGETRVTGVLALLVRAITAVVTSMAESYVIAFGVITPLMILLLGSLRAGLVAMIPNLLPIGLTLGLMGFVGFPLDAFTLMTGGIAIGLAVDDTIHFMHNYRRYRDQGDSLEAAVDKTLATAGRAMAITTIVLSVGFLGFVLSSMANLTNLGILVAFAIVTAFFADVLVAPALLARLDARRD